MQKVFVLDTEKRPLTPCRPKRARQLLAQKKAAVFGRYPFTIILKESKPQAHPRPLRLKLDPGSKTTGIAIIDDLSGEVVFAAELKHRGQRIKGLLDSRRAARRSRRNRKTRYRKPRFLNRTRPKGWLAPSLESRVKNTETWVKRLCMLSPVKALSQVLVRFDTQAIQNPEISGVEYQQGTLFGYEVKEYLLEKWGRKCAYCSVTNKPLEVDHIFPRSRGGSDRVSNLTLVCVSCNQDKGNMPVEEFLKRKPEVLKRIKAQAEASLKDAAAVNTTRWALFELLKATGLPVEAGSGGLTKFNRFQHGLEKRHWTDAACVGKSTPKALKTEGIKPMLIKAMGHGSRQMCRVDRFGFPRTSAKANKVVKGFQTGDMVKAVVTKGKRVGTYVGRVAVRASGSFNVKTEVGTVQGISYKYCHLLHRADGYNYN